ncbi:MAG: hypothetical protein QF464_04310, partial [Myxococcota bacterium]|nr:hypothetical protein [Myxococcota bacterium]
IEKVSEEISWPSVDELTGLSAEQVDELAQQGFPSSLSAGTFAHLQGALELSGDCALIESLSGFSDNPQLVSLDIEVISCTEDARCADICPDNFYGMTFTATVRLNLIDEAKAQEIKDQLAEISPDAIVQIRFLVYELEFFQELGQSGTKVSIHPWLDDFTLSLGDVDDNQVLVIDYPYLDSITPETPQRFDVDSSTDFTQNLKASILAGQPVDIEVILSMSIAQPDLYEVGIDGAGLDIDIQPEIIVSVIEVVKSKI